MMRTTVTLDSDAEHIVRRRMAQRHVSFKRALNDLIREGQASAAGRPQFQTRTRPMGLPAVGLDKALRLAVEFEDEELVRRMEAGA